MAKLPPGFYFTSNQKGQLPKLPPVEVPFGLHLMNAQVTDASLKELKDLKNLTALDLGYTEVSDAGLTEVKCRPSNRPILAPSFSRNKTAISPFGLCPNDATQGAPSASE